MLGHLRRKSAPAVSMDAVLERWQRRRRRTWAAVGLASLALVLAFRLIPRRPAAETGTPPVYLELHVVDVAPDQTGLPQDVLADVYDRPWEVRGP